MADLQPVKVPPTFKTLLPFIRRAEELDRDTSRPESKLIAYFCRQYAMELGIKLRENDASTESTDYLLSLMDRLEDEKNKLPEFSQEEGKEICEDFAIEIFTKADDEDRAGRADKSTARTFYAAGTFFDILTQFGDISEDVVEKRRYCKYKAATILKAIKEGKAPMPGPPEGVDFKADDDEVNNASESTTIVSSTSTPLVPAVEEPPAKPLSRSKPLYSQTDSTRSAGAMSFSELDNTWHGPAPTQSPPHPPAPSHTAPVACLPSAYSAPTTPAAPPPAYKPPPTPLPAYKPLTVSTPAYDPPSAPTSSNQSPSAPALPNQPPSVSTLPLQPQPNHTSQSTPARVRNTPASQNEINDAIEYAKFAIAALKVKDIKLAEEQLDKALRNIRGA